MKIEKGGKIKKKGEKKTQILDFFFKFCFLGVIRYKYINRLTMFKLVQEIYLLTNVSSFFTSF